jgi:hypothetical protein
VNTSYIVVQYDPGHGNRHIQYLQRISFSKKSDLTHLLDASRYTPEQVMFALDDVKFFCEQTDLQERFFSLVQVTVTLVPYDLPK